MTTSLDADDGNDGSEQKQKVKILGVCGGIGSGKSTACQLMVDSLGCMARIDADKLAHVVYEPGSEALVEIAQEFGKDVLDDDDNAQIDRKKLGAIVFSDANSMSKLEHIVWPHVRTKIEERIREITTQENHQSSPTTATTTNDTTSNNNIIIVEAALLLETDWHDLLDGLWVIQSSPNVATTRLVQSRGLTEEEAGVRIRAQETRRGIGGVGSNTVSAVGEEVVGDKLRREMEDGVVTAVITNDGTLGELQRSLEKALWDDAASFKE